MKNFNSLLIFSLIILLCACQPAAESHAHLDTKGLTKITIMYPNGEGKHFDMEYYATSHMPMLKELFGDAMKKLEIDKGISGRTPEDPLPYLAIGYLYFESIEAYGKAFGPNRDKILSDIPNYTNIQPVIQISEVVE